MIPVEEIKKVQTYKVSFLSVHPFSGPSLARDRLEIIIGKQQQMISISPEAKKEFLNQLLKENRNLEA